MARKSRLEIVEREIVSFFDTLPKKAFGYNEIGEILSSHRNQWSLPDTVYTAKFIEFLVKLGLLEKIKLHSKSYSPLDRYTWRNPSIYSIAQSIKKTGYLSHGSAVFLHGLTDLIPKTVYLNYEQSPKPQRGVLVQENIHRAFAGKQRQSNLIYDFENYRITLINGKNTNRLEVAPLAPATSELVETTKLERTLIDIAVRPSYAGGVFEVLEVYKRAKDIASVSVLISTLKKLTYLYPYHQVIGFYMERAGYPEKQLKQLRNIGLDFDFYITYGLPKDRKYDSGWRIFYPQGF